MVTQDKANLLQTFEVGHSREIHQPAQVGVQRLKLILEPIETGRSETTLRRQARALVKVKTFRRAVVVLRAGADNIRICVHLMTTRDEIA